MCFICFLTEEQTTTSKNWYAQENSSFCLSLQQIMHFLFTEKELQCDTDDDSGIGSSVSTDTKSTNFSDVSHWLP